MGCDNYEENIIFGKCPLCGNNGADYATVSACDSTSNLDTTGNGISLIKFRGDVMCTLCKDIILSREESERMAEKHAEAQRFRSALGFKTSV
jgi:hypothetical protein